MSEKFNTIHVNLQDDANSQIIMEKIRAEKITDPATIRNTVNNYEFSSPETQQHISDRIIDLLNMGTFNNVPPKTIKFDAVDTDAHNL